MIPSSYHEWIEDEARKERAADERERFDRFMPLIPEPEESDTATGDNEQGTSDGQHATQ